MPRKTSFSIVPDQVVATSETLKGYKTQLDQMADKLTKAEQDIRRTQLGAGVSDMYANTVKSIQDNIYYSGRRMDQLSQVAAWCALRYANAERTILGEQPTPMGNRPGSIAKPGAPVIPTGSQPGNKNDGHGSKYYEEDSHWDAWNYERTKKRYDDAHVVKYTDDDGNVKEKVTRYTGYHEKKVELGFVNTTKREAQEGTKLGDTQKRWNDSLNDKYGYNKFKSDDHDKDWSNRVYDKNGRVAQGQENENSFSEDIMGAELFSFNLSAKGTLWGAQDRATGKYGEAGGSVEVLTGEAHFGGGVGAYYVMKDGRKVLALGANLEAGVSATVFHANADVQTYVKARGSAAEWLGEDFQFIGAKAEADVKIGHVEANGGLKCRWIDGQPELAAEASAGAYALKASAQGSVTCLGISATAKAEVNIGIGATAKIGLTGGKLRCELGASLGIGFKISFDIDISGAVNAIKNVATKVGSAIAKGVKKIFSGW